MTQKRLPDIWIRRIFAHLQGHYGTRFLNMWKTGQILPDGNDAGMVNAMNHWAEKLGGFVDFPDDIKSVLNNLPVDPPSLPQFYQMLCAVHTPNVKKYLIRTQSLEEKAQEKENAKKYLKQIYEVLKK